VLKIISRKNVSRLKAANLLWTMNHHILLGVLGKEDIAVKIAHRTFKIILYFRNKFR
jgi:hypothetical protein